MSDSFRSTMLPLNNTLILYILKSIRYISISKLSWQYIIYIPDILVRFNTYFSFYLPISGIIQLHSCTFRYTMCDVEPFYISCGCNRTPHCLDWASSGVICFGASHAVAIYYPEVMYPMYSGDAIFSCQWLIDLVLRNF